MNGTDLSAALDFNLQTSSWNSPSPRYGNLYRFDPVRRHSSSRALIGRLRFGIFLGPQFRSGLLYLAFPPPRISLLALQLAFELWSVVLRWPESPRVTSCSDQRVMTSDPSMLHIKASPILLISHFQTKFPLHN